MLSRLLSAALVLALASPPVQAAWSGDCAPSTDPAIASLFGTLDDAADIGLSSNVGGGAPGPMPAAAPTATPFPVPKELAGKLPNGKRIVGGTRRFLDVPHREQQGSLCGFYAMKMALDFWEKTEGAAAPRAEDLFDQAVSNSATKDGYVTTTGLATATEDFGFTVERKTQATLEDLADAIDAGIPPVVLFVVDNDPTSPGHGGPARKENPDMNAGHFAVIQAIYTDSSGEKWVVAKHGWAKKESYVWRASDFERSWALRNREMLLVQP